MALGREKSVKFFITCEVLECATTITMTDCRERAGRQRGKYFSYGKCWNVLLLLLWLGLQRAREQERERESKEEWVVHVAVATELRKC